MALLCAAAAFSGCDQGASLAPKAVIPPALKVRFYPPEGWTFARLDMAGAPSLRYGVASPPVQPRGQAVIVADAGEPAEVWFETVRDLNARRYTVWVLELAGQGGSERYRLAGRRPHLEDAGLDPRAVRRLVTAVVRPRPLEPVLLIGHGLGARMALLAAAGTPALPARLALVRPLSAAERCFDPAEVATGERLKAAHLDWWPSGQRPAPARHDISLDPERARLAALWLDNSPALANDGPTFGWIRALHSTAVRARSAQFAGPMLETSMAVHLAPDAARQAWLDQLVAADWPRAQPSPPAPCT